MVGTTHRRREAMLARFDRVERLVHWANALAFTILIFTGAALYLEPISALVGRRHLVEQIHVWCGVCLPVPVLAGVAGAWGRGLRADLARLNRWTDADIGWLKAAGRSRVPRAALRAELLTGKFNAGQKLNTAFVGGSIVVMLATGVIMRWYHPWPLSTRTGATFVHDWLSAAIVIVVIGHVLHALADRDSMRSMWRGRIPDAWAALHAPAWHAEVEEEQGPPGR